MSNLGSIDPEKPYQAILSLTRSTVLHGSGTAGIQTSWHMSCRAKCINFANVGLGSLGKGPFTNSFTL